MPGSAFRRTLSNIFDELAFSTALIWPYIQVSALHPNVAAVCIDSVLRATVCLGVNTFPPSLCDSYLLTFRYSDGYHQQEIGLWSLKRTLADKLTTGTLNQTHRHELFGSRCFQFPDFAVFLIFYYRSVWGTDDSSSKNPIKETDGCLNYTSVRLRWQILEIRVIPSAQTTGYVWGKWGVWTTKWRWHKQGLVSAPEWKEKMVTKHIPHLQTFHPQLIPQPRPLLSASPLVSTEVWRN